jgi:hypothetical protein
VAARTAPFVLDASSLIVPEPSGVALIGIAGCALFRWQRSSRFVQGGPLEERQ